MKNVKKFILGIKKGMTQVFDESGRVYPVTIVQAGPVVVTQIRTEEKDGYNAIQVGFGEKSEKNIKKPQKGQFKDVGNFAFVREFRVEDPSQFKVGDKIDVSVFEEGENVEVTGTSKGKGFQGVVKRWNFAGGPKSHGQKHNLRSPGSIGAQGPQRVFKGKKMPGRTGGKTVTVKNLKLVQIDKEDGLLLIHGAVPGPRGSLVEVKVK